MIALVARFALAVMLAAPLLAGPARASDDKALRIADEVMETLGGKESWERARFIHFTFVRQGRRLNITWDRYLGRYRLEARNDAGVPYIVVMNLFTRQGRVEVEGRPLEGAELSDYLTRAERIWAGEIYWLLAPYKLRDPGAVLTYDGEETVGETVYDRLHLRFDNVGITPGDVFWMYINRSTHLLERWRFRLESGVEGDFRWSGWKRFGGILLATERSNPKGEQILFENIVVSDSLPEEVFTSFEPLRLP